MLQVAFCYSNLVDDGKVVIWGGKRVQQDFQGQGLLTKLTIAVEEFISSRYPNITTWRYTAAWNDFQRKHIPKLKEMGALKKLVMRVSSKMTIMHNLLQEIKSCGMKISQISIAVFRLWTCIDIFVLCMGKRKTFSQNYYGK